MDYKDYFTKDNRDKESIRILLDEVNVLTINADRIQKCIEIIEQVCCIPDTKITKHKELLLNKANDLKKSVMLHRSATKRLLVAADKLLNGVPEDKILADICTYNIFLSDQLKCANDDMRNILLTLSMEAVG